MFLLWPQIILVLFDMMLPSPRVIKIMSIIVWEQKNAAKVSFDNM